VVMNLKQRDRCSGSRMEWLLLLTCCWQDFLYEFLALSRFSSFAKLWLFMSY
jgi:hypothetical protein